MTATYPGSISSPISRPQPSSRPQPAPQPPIRLGVLHDYREEQWASMDLVGEMILWHLRAEHAGTVEPLEILPPFRHRATRLAPSKAAWTARNLDRLCNRFWDYPRYLQRRLRAERFDLFHLVDHSYAQLVHVLPPERTIVMCHDLDTFRCLLEPQREPRPLWFRIMTRRILDGFRQAAVVVCNSVATQQAIRTHDLVPEARLHVVPIGIAPEFHPEADPVADREAARLLGPLDPKSDGAIELLHVGTTIPRKRIDVLLEAFAALRRRWPEARLVKAGHPLTPEQQRHAQALGIAEAIVTLPSLERRILSAVYRRATLVLQPSEAEGFGLPVAEAQACGAVVLASDLDVLREVGGDAAVYRSVADVPAWTEAALELLEQRRADPDAWNARRLEGQTQAARFQWSAHVNRLVAIYQNLAGG